MLANNSLFICLISLLLLLVSSVSSSALLSQSKQHLTGRRLVVTNVSNAASGGRFGAPSLGMGATNQLAHQQLSQQQIQKQKLASWAEGLARTEQAMAQHKLLNDQTLERQKLSQKGEELKHQVEEYKKAKQQVDEIMKGIAFYNKEIPERRAVDKMYEKVKDGIDKMNNYGLWLLYVQIWREPHMAFVWGTQTMGALKSRLADVKAKVEAFPPGVKAEYEANKAAFDKFERENNERNAGGLNPFMGGVQMDTFPSSRLAKKEEIKIYPKMKAEHKEAFNKFEQENNERNAISPFERK